MKRLALRALPFAIAALGACGGSMGGGDDASANGEPDPGDTEGDTDGDDPLDPDDPLAACGELDAASGWLRGEDIEATAESTPERIAAVGARTWDLSLELMRVIEAHEAASVAASPASMVAAMGLAYGRHQNGQCGERIAEVMAFPETGDAIHHTIGASLRELEARALEADETSDPVVISLRQSVWGFGSSLPEPSPLQEIYGAVANVLPAPDAAARELINCVIEEESQGLLPDFLPMDHPRPDTTAYDINVAFLQAPWATQMLERPLEFTFRDGSTGSVEAFGSSLAQVELYQGEAFTSVAIPLRGGALTMLAVVPPAGDLEAFVDALDAEALATARTEAHFAYVDLTLPKVAIASKTFDYNAGRLEFECEPFTLRDVLHGAAVEIDDKGIKAAAATVAEEWSDGGETPEPELVLAIDRPFLFFVYDRSTEYVLYSGRYAPEQA